MLPQLSKLLTYNNAHVLGRYSKDYPNNQLSPEQAMQELMKFFWLALKQKSEKQHFPDNEELIFTFGIHSEMKEIDDMWHTFLLFTKDYIAFCKEYLGEFFHHSPNVEDDKEALKENDFEKDFYRFIAFVFDHLGEDTLKIWFRELL